MAPSLAPLKDTARWGMRSGDPKRAQSVPHRGLPAGGITWGAAPHPPRPRPLVHPPTGVAAPRVSSVRDGPSATATTAAIERRGFVAGRASAAHGAPQRQHASSWRAIGPPQEWQSRG